MRFQLFAAAALALNTVSLTSFADEVAPAAAAPAGAAPAPAPVDPVAPGVAPTMPAEGAVVPAAEASEPSGPKSGTTCLMGYHPPEYPDSARTATALVCDELRKRGIPVGGLAYEPGNAAAAYVVHLDQLGSTFFLRVVHEEPIGTVRASQRISLSELSEAEVAAPRLADALVGKKAIEETQNYENVVGSESRKYKKKSGEFVIGGGLAGLSLPGSEAFMGPALNLFAYYETTHLGLGLQFHFGDASTDSDEDADFVAWSVGGRYYLTDGDVTPLFGAGLAMASISTSTGGPYQYEGNGLTAFGEVGVEVFRLYSTHFIASLRVDAPFFTMQATDNGYDYYDYSTGVSTTETTLPGDKRYDVPITLNVGIGF